MVGLNIQYPWSHLLINGLKTVETRSYALPNKYAGEPLALIETPGKTQNFKSRIIGIIVFSHSFKYPDKESWLNDFNRHKVSDSDNLFAWNDSKDKYGWVVSNVIKFNKPIDAPTKKGIVFTLNCNISDHIYEYSTTE